MIDTCCGGAVASIQVPEIPPFIVAGVVDTLARSPRYPIAAAVELNTVIFTTSFIDEGATVDVDVYNDDTVIASYTVSVVPVQTFTSAGLVYDEGDLISVAITAFTGEVRDLLVVFRP